MIHLDDSKVEELASFVEMELAADTAEFILPYDLERHRREFQRDDIHYLSIYDAGGLAGFFILALEADGRSVEFRRVVIDSTRRGIGQAAIRLMESYCRDRLGRERVWLDVFEFNRRGRHIYQKLGYRYFDQTELEGKTLLFFDKQLDQPN